MLVLPSEGGPVKDDRTALFALGSRMNDNAYRDTIALIAAVAICFAACWLWAFPELMELLP